MSNNNQITVSKQKELTFSETFDFCLSSIKHRFFRSILTLAVVVLAVAFFMYLLTDNVYRSSLRKGVGAEIKQARKSSVLLNIMLTRPTQKEFELMLAKSSDNPELKKMLVSVLKADDDKISELADLARKKQRYLRFFKDMKIGQRKLLIGRLSGDEIFLNLADQKNFEKFKDDLAPMGNLKLPGGYESFYSYLADYKNYMKKRDLLHKEWNHAISYLLEQSSKLSGSRPLKDVLASETPEDRKKVEEFYKIINNAGFNISKEDYKGIVGEMKKAKLKEKIILTLNKPEIRSEWRGIFKEKYKKISDKLKVLDDPRVVKLLKDSFKEDQLKMISSEIRYEDELSDLEYKLDFGIARTESGLSNKDIYLLVLSFIVCMVGIANAMLMSITERFREIATLKCLGATDMFILVQITIEAALQGVAGGFLGVLIGLIITTVKDSLIFGTRLFEYFPVSGVGIAMGVSLVAGVLLSVFASIYPAWKAAKMAPMEAMRVE
jgi:ABC-type antimicrobial peptide transport system permease subunit